MISNVKMTKFVTLVSAVLLTATGCTKDSGQSETSAVNKATPAAVEQLAPAVREQTDTMKKAAVSVQGESSEPESMDDLLDGIKDRIDSDKKYVAAVVEAVPTASLALATKPGTYTVKSGDSLASIAKSYYGDSAKYMAIYNANKDILANPNSLNVGQVLTFP